MDKEDLMFILGGLMAVIAIFQDSFSLWLTGVVLALIGIFGE